MCAVTHLYVLYDRGEAVVSGVMRCWEVTLGVCGLLSSRFLLCTSVVLLVRWSSVIVSVHRPALIGPSSTTGQGNQRDWLSLLIRASLDIGVVPMEHEEDYKMLFLVPVDYVAKGVVMTSLGCSRGTYSKVVCVWMCACMCMTCVCVRACVLAWVRVCVCVNMFTVYTVNWRQCYRQPVNFSSVFMYAM